MKEELDKLARASELKVINVDEALEVIELLYDLKTVLDDDMLYVDRVVGLKNATIKKDPLDCPYVQKALRYTLSRGDGWLELKKILHELKGRIG